MADTKQNEREQREAQAATPSDEVQVAVANDISEGEVKALRSDAGLDQLAGHEANVHAWEASAAGKEFLKGEKDRQKAIAEEAKARQAATNKDGLTESEAKYVEAINKARKG